MLVIRKGWGFDVEHDFARATKDTPIEIATDEYAKPGCVIGYIEGNPESTLGFMRHPRIRVHVKKQALTETSP